MRGPVLAVPPFFKFAGFIKGASGAPFLLLPVVLLAIYGREGRVPFLVPEARVPRERLFFGFPSGLRGMLLLPVCP